MKKLLLIALTLSIGSMLHATSYYYKQSDGKAHASNPANLNQKAALSASALSLQVLSHNLLTHAAPAQAKEPEWFRAPEMSFEYNFTYNDDTRPGGLDSDIHGATMGLGWLTYWDISMGAMLSGNTSDGDAVNDLQDDSESVVGTVYLSKSFYDWFFVGTTASIGATEDNNKTATTSAETDIDSYTISAYMGAYVTEGNWVFSVIPTYMVTMQNYYYRGLAPDQSSSTGTILVTTNIGYNFNENFSINVNVTPNIIVHDEVTTNMGVRGDDLWMNTGITGDYKFDETWSLNMNYSYDAFNSDYNNHNANVGTVCRF